VTASTVLWIIVAMMHVMRIETFIIDLIKKRFDLKKRLSSSLPRAHFHLHATSILLH
jgi:hypothetical protein